MPLQRADLAVGALTITYQRQSVITFTKPYLDIQLGMLLGQPSQREYNPWSFLMPLSNSLWLLTIASAFIVAIVICFLDKASPYGHYGKQH